MEDSHTMEDNHIIIWKIRSQISIIAGHVQALETPRRSSLHLLLGRSDSHREILAFLWLFFCCSFISQPCTRYLVPSTRYLVPCSWYLMILSPNYSAHMYCTPLHQVPLGPGGEVYPGWADLEGRSNRRLLPPIQRGANKNQVPIFCGSDLSDF